MPASESFQYRRMKSRPHYSTADLQLAYRKIGIREGDIVYFTGNVGNFGFHESFGKPQTLAAHYAALNSAVGETGTLVVPTHSFSLCNTDRIFDAAATPSERGPLTEYARLQEGSVRQFHPFASVTALGPDAENLCENCTRHAYGPGTPFDRMIQKNAWFLSLALPPQHTCSIVHHVEMLMGVPYRYTKEYLHPTKRGREVNSEPFYQFVTYREAHLERDRNEKIFQHPQLKETLLQVQVGLGAIWAYRMQDFYQAATDCLSLDIYAWLKQPPAVRPYQK